MAFVPVVILSFILASLMRVNSTEKKVSPERTPEQEQTDEIVTVILPAINSK